MISTLPETQNADYHLQPYPQSELMAYEYKLIVDGNKPWSLWPRHHIAVYGSCSPKIISAFSLMVDSGDAETPVYGSIQRYYAKRTFLPQVSVSLIIICRGLYKISSVTARSSSHLNSATLVAALALTTSRTLHAMVHSLKLLYTNSHLAFFTIFTRN
jgi:hypothetical protein